MEAYGVVRRGPSGTPRSIFGTALDITDRKRAEEEILLREQALVNSERFLKTIIDSEPECIKLLDSECNLIMMNRAGLEIIDAESLEQVKGQSMAQLVTDAYRAEFIALTKRVFEGTPGVLEFEAVGINGRHIWLETHAVPFCNELGEITSLLGITRDVTEKRRLEEERAALEQQLHQAQKMESLGVLAGGIAHDFNNILAVIMCYSSLGQQKPEKAAEFMPEIEKASERAAGLCRQMLAYAGKTQFVESNVDVTALVDDIIIMLKSTLPQNAAIKPYLTGDLPCIEGDASQLRQIVMNLIINASEAIGEEHGDIRVALTKTDITTGQQEKDHSGKVITPGSYLCLEVTDTGCGMDDETKQRIFEPFYTTKFVGRGLGMSAVLGIITSHKGALQLSSQPGHGTTFKVYLPVQNGENSVEPLQQNAPTAWQGSGTILLVEDEPQLILVAKNLMKALGFSVIEATNGKEALELYRKNAAEIGLVLTDIGMPLMNGYQLIRELKRINPKLPIIVSSGFGDTDVISRIAPGDVSGVISKPYSFDQLRDVLKSVVEGVP
jgi:PAS domain S-box-containing protein